MDAPPKRPRGRPPKPAMAAAEKLHDAADQAGGPMETLDNVPLASTSKRTSRRHTGSAASNDNKSSISMDNTAKTKKRSKRSAAGSAFEETNSKAPPRKRGRPLKGNNVSNSKKQRTHTSTDEHAVNASADMESSDE